VPHLAAEQIQPFLSPYLMAGWRKDCFALDSVDVEPGYIRGVIHAAEYYESAEGEFHLTVPSVFIWVAQLAIIYGCWDQKLSKKPGEIYVRDIRLKCKRAITSPKQLEFVLLLASKRNVPEGVFYSGTISVDRDAFVGDGRFVLPLPCQASIPLPQLGDGVSPR